MIPLHKREIKFSHPIVIPKPILYEATHNFTKRGNYNSIDVNVNPGMKPTVEEFINEIETLIKIHNPDSVVFTHIFQYLDTDLSWRTKGDIITHTEEREITYNRHRFPDMTFREYVSNILEIKFKEMYGEDYSTYDKLDVLSEAINVSYARLWIPRIGHGSEDTSESYDVKVGDTIYHVTAVSEPYSRTCFYDVLETYIDSEVVDTLRSDIDECLPETYRGGVSEHMLTDMHLTLCDYGINVITPHTNVGCGITCRMMLTNGHWVRIVDTRIESSKPTDNSHLIVAYDFETVDDKPYMFSMYDPVNGASVIYNDVPNTTAFNTRVRELINSRAAKGVTFVGFNSAVYDDLYLLRILKLTDWTVLKGSGNSILSMTHKRSKATFIDVCKFLKMSLAKACTMLNIENPKLSLDHEAVRQQYLRDGYVNVTDDMIQYSRRDVTALYEVWTRAKKLFSEVFDMNATGCMTLSQMSYRRFVKTNGKKVPQLTVAMDSFGYVKGYREFLTGGKCHAMIGIHRPLKLIRVYDVNSLYPYVMMTHKFVLRAETWRRTTAVVWHGVYKVRVSRHAVPCVIPLRLDGVLCWDPSEGHYEGFASGVDIGEHAKYGGTLEVLDGFAYTEVTESMKMFDFLKEIAEIKRVTVDPSTRDVAKLLMNSLSGKMTQQNITHEHIISLDLPAAPNHSKVTGTNFYVNKVEKSSMTVTGSFINGVLIYSYARAVLNGYLAMCRDWYYCDTDSVFTTDVIETSDAIGAMKLEAEGDEMYVGGKKAYTLRRCGVVVKSALKGVNRVKGYYNNDSVVSNADTWLVRAMDAGDTEFSVTSVRCKRDGLSPHFAAVTKTISIAGC